MSFMSFVCHTFASVPCCLVVRSPAGKGLTSCLLFVMFDYVFVTFRCGILGQVWYLIVSIPDLCRLFYFTYLGFCFSYHCLESGNGRKNDKTMIRFLLNLVKTGLNHVLCQIAENDLRLLRFFKSCVIVPHRMVRWVDKPISSNNFLIKYLIATQYTK